MKEMIDAMVKNEISPADGYAIRSAGAGELAALREIERAAGEVFRQVGLTIVAESEPMPLALLRDRSAQGRVWVAVDSGDAPVGFAVAGMIDRAAHLEEVSVHPAHGRRGLGARLVLRVCRWAQEASLPAVTLSTFRDLAWNAPFYARLGFRPLGEEELSPGLREALRREAEAGLPAERRVCMRRDL